MKPTPVVYLLHGSAYGVSAPGFNLQQYQALCQEQCCASGVALCGVTFYQGHVYHGSATTTCPHRKNFRIRPGLCFCFLKKEDPPIFLDSPWGGYRSPGTTALSAPCPVCKAAPACCQALVVAASYKEKASEAP